MDKFVQSDIKSQAVENGTWLSSINSTLPIAFILAVSLILGGMAVVNYCLPSCQLF